MYGMYRGPQQVRTHRVGKEIITRAYAAKLIRADRAIILFKLTSKGADPVRATYNNQQAVTRFLQVVKEYGIRDEDIFFTSEEIRIIPNEEDNTLNSYEAATLFQIIFTTLDDLSQFLYNLRAIDVVPLDITLTISNQFEAWNETFEEATAKALTRAKSAAKEMEVEIDEIPLELKDLTNLEEISKQIQENLIKEFSSLGSGITNVYSIVEARYTIIE